MALVLPCRLVSSAASSTCFNHAAYKSCLFYTAGSVESQTGTTDLRQISGLGRKMPVTMVSFIVAAASIAGFPFTNGFYSKELIFDGALETNVVFYLVALIGAFLQRFPS